MAAKKKAKKVDPGMENLLSSGSTNIPFSSPAPETKPKEEEEPLPDTLNRNVKEKIGAKAKAQGKRTTGMVRGVRVGNNLVTEGDDPFFQLTNSNDSIHSRLIRHVNKLADHGHYLGNLDAIRSMIADGAGSVASATAAHLEGYTIGPKVGKTKQGREYRSEFKERTSGVGSENTYDVLFRGATPSATPNNAYDHLKAAASSYGSAARELAKISMAISRKTGGQSHVFTDIHPTTGLSYRDTSDQIANRYLNMTHGDALNQTPLEVTNEAGFTVQQVANRAARYEQLPAVGASQRAIDSLYPGLRTEAQGAQERQAYVASGAAGRAATREEFARLVNQGRLPKSGQAPETFPSSARPLRYETNRIAPEVGSRRAGYAEANRQADTEAYRASLSATERAKFDSDVAASKAASDARTVRSGDAYDSARTAAYLASPGREAKEAEDRAANAALMDQKARRVPDISPEAKSKFIAAHVARGIHPEIAEQNWKKVEDYTNKATARIHNDDAYKTYLPNIRTTAAREELERITQVRRHDNPDPLATAAGVEREYRLQKRREEMAANAPIAEQHKNDFETHLTNIQNIAETTNENGSYRYPQARKAINKAVTRWNRHLGASSTGEKLTHLDDAVSHMYDAAAILSHKNNGVTHPSVMEAVATGFSDLKSRYQSAIAGSNNPTGAYFPYARRN